MAIQQKLIGHNPRSTVGTTTEIYDYLKLLFARAGKTFSPDSGEVVKKDDVADVVNFIHQHEDGTRIQLLSPLHVKDGRKPKEELELLIQKGLTRVLVKDQVLKIEDILSNGKHKVSEDMKILIDRIVVDNQNETNINRISDSVETTFFEGEGECIVQLADNGVQRVFSNKFELDGVMFEEPSSNLFSFNNPYGACTTCEGFGNIIGIDENLVIPNKTLSVFKDAVACWKGPKMKRYKLELVNNSHEFDFPIHRPYNKLSEDEKELLWTGNQYFKGINKFFRLIERKKRKIQYRVMLSRFRGKTTCPDCKGTRLRKDASYVKVSEKSIVDI